MAVKTKILYLTVGSTSITDASLAGTRILRVCRDGIGYNSTSDLFPGNREYKHIASRAELLFLNPGVPFSGPGSSSDTDPERIYMRYKTL